MTDASGDNPRGLFDRSTKGRRLPSVTVGVERGRMQFFAKILGETNPVYFDVAAARNAGYPDIIAPPSFFMVLEAAANELLKALGQFNSLQLIKCDYRYLLHGDEKYDYHGLIHAGDELAFGTRVVDFYDKKGGALEFATLESEVSHAERGLIVRSVRNLLHRLP